MRILITMPFLLLCACQVSEDGQNDAVTVQFNQDIAENAAADIANGAEQAGGAIVNGAKEAGETIRNVDVDVDVDTNTANNEPANSN